IQAEGAPSPVLSAGDYLQIDLTDTGPGMDAATLRRAAEPFFTTKPTGQGTGLGLSMARGFAEQSGGALAIWSEPGKGTRVTMWFPDARGSASTAAVLEHSPLEARPHTRALVVDDDPMVREILGEQLRSIGYEIKLATDGLDALNQLDTGTVVDVLVTDFSMPGMSGVILIEEARRRLPTLPAILLTGFADGALRLKLDEEQSRFTALLRKPVNEADLAERLEAVLLAASPERT
ncbi:MAG: response regulator, partial [Tardiphaga sp.]|nr:response regulator [Tardiphaga sp.]